jgi:hypothetical protein
MRRVYNRGADMDYEIIEVTEKNLSGHPQVICFINPKQESYPLKIDWLKDQFRRGLRIKLLYLTGEKKPFGFVEYVPGESCWRGVDAAGYLFIHCLWTNGKKNQHKGYGSLLLDEVEKDAAGMKGVAVLTSDKAFMQQKDIFLKRGYEIADEEGKEQLLAKRFGEAPLPGIKDGRKRLEDYQDWTILYSRQCPWVARFIEELKPVLEEYGLKPRIIELKTAEEAQNAPSVYATFNLIHKGRLLADRYISTTRFKNILNKELK